MIRVSKARRPVLRQILLWGLHWFGCASALLAAEPIRPTAGPVVLDSVGKPVAAALVRVFGTPASTSIVSDLGSGFWKGETDEMGRLPIPLPRLAKLLIVVDHPRFAPALVEPLVPLGAIRIVDGVQVKGKVAGSKKISGRVCARWEVALPEWSRKFPFERCSAVDAERRWFLSGLGDEPVLLTAEVEGFLPATRAWRRGGEPVVFSLDPGFLVAGRLVDPVGESVRDARIESDGASPVGVDENGAFRLAVPVLPATVRISAPGLRPRRYEAPAKAPKQPVEIRLQWGQQIKGIVLSPDGQPLSQVSLVASRWLPQNQGWTPESFDLKPARNGTFEVDLPRPGEYRLRFKSKGLRSDPYPRQLIAQGAVVDLGVVPFDQGAGVRCRIVDEATGDPLEGVEARLVGRGSSLLAQMLEGGGISAASNVAGELLLSGVEAGAYRLRLRREGYAAVADNLDLMRGELHDHGEIALAPAIEVIGRVVARDGHPMPGARVRFFAPPADGFEPMAEVVADGAGRFVGAQLSAGEYIVWVDRERRLLSQSFVLERPVRGRKVEADLVIPSVRLVVHLERGGQVVEGGGWVTLTSELDLSDSRLKMQFQSSGEVTRGHELLNRPDRPQTATVREDGSFEIADAPAGAARLEFIAPDGSSVTRRLAVPDLPTAELTVDLGGLALRGRLIDGQTEAGLVGLVQLVDAAGHVVVTLPSNAEGEFEALDLVAASYALRATSEGYQPVIQRVDLTAAVGEPVILALRQGSEGSLGLHFERADGNPAAGVVAHLLDGAGRLVGACVGDATGRCGLSKVPVGGYLLAWNDPLAGAGGRTPILVETGEETAIEHRLISGGPLTLRCSSCAGATLEGLLVLTGEGVNVTPYLEGMAPALRFGVGGELALGRLNAGPFLVRVKVAGRESQHGIEVQSGGSVVLDLDPVVKERAPSRGVETPR